MADFNIQIHGNPVEQSISDHGSAHSITEDLLMEAGSQLYMDWLASDIGSERMSPPHPIFLESSPLFDQDEIWSDLFPQNPFIEDANGNADSLGENTETGAESPCGSEDSTDLEAGAWPEGEAQACTNIHASLDEEDIILNGVSPALLSNQSDNVTTKSMSSPIHAGGAQELLDSHQNFGESCRSRPATLASGTEPELNSRKKARMSPQSVLEETDTNRAAPWPMERSSSLPKAEFGKTKTQDSAPSTSRGKAGQNPPASKDSRWAEQLLNACATAIASNNVIRTQHLMWVLNDLASLTGDANQRLAAHGLKALFSRVTGNGGSSAPLLPDETASGLGPRPVHSALLRFHDVSPWHNVIYTIANGELLDACEGHKIVHVVDIGISQGIQWPTFIEALATRPSGAPALLRLTTVRDPRAPLSMGTSSDFLGRLELFANRMGLKLEMQSVSTPLEALKRDDLGLRDGEALAICGQFRLHHLNDEILKSQDADSTSEVEELSPRDCFLKTLRDLNPDVFLLSENDADHCSSDFLTRFQKVVDFYWKFLDSTNASFRGQECEERLIIESDAALALLNNVACEGDSRIERNESHLAWSARMQKAGFSPILPKDEVLENARSLLRKYDHSWDVWTDDSCMILRWKGQPATFCSVWRS